MHNWRFLLLALVAVLQPAASFTERDVDGRQQCCNRQHDSPFRDTRLSVDDHRIIPQDKRQNQRDETFTGHRIATKLSTTRSPVNERNYRERIYAERSEDARTALNLDRAIANRRNFRQFERLTLDRNPRERFTRDSIARRNDVDSKRTVRDERSASPDDKSGNRVISETRKQKTFNKFRSTTEARHEFQATRYEVDQERVKNNARITKERRDVNKIPAIESRLDHNINLRSKELRNESRKIDHLRLENTDFRRNYKEKLSRSTVTKDRRTEDKKIPYSDVRFHRSVDRSNIRDVDESRRSTRSESRRHVDIDVTRKEVREQGNIDLRNIVKNEVSRRQTVGKTEGHRDTLLRAQSEVRQIRSVTRQRNSNSMQRLAVNEDRNRNTQTRAERRLSYSAGEEMIRRETRRDTRNGQTRSVVERRLSSEIPNTEYSILRDDQIQSESSRRDVRNVNRDAYIDRERSQVRPLRSLADSHRETRGDNRYDGRNNLMLGGEERKQRQTSDTRENRRDIRNAGNRHLNVVRRRSLDVDRDRARNTINRSSIRKDTRNDASRTFNAQDSTRQTILMRQQSYTDSRDANMRPTRERADDNLTRDTRQTDLRTSIRDTKRTTKDESRASVERMNLHDSTRTERSTKSVLGERKQNSAMNNIRDRIIESRFRDADVRNRNIDKEFSKINSEKIIGNLQMLFYIMQGVYVCSVIMQAFKENGSANKTKNKFWWIMASQYPIKVD